MLLVLMDGFEKIVEDFIVGNVKSKSVNGFGEYVPCSVASMSFLFIIISWSESNICCSFNESFLLHSCPATDKGSNDRQRIIN